MSTEEIYQAIEQGTVVMYEPTKVNEFFDNNKFLGNFFRKGLEQGGLTPKKEYFVLEASGPRIIMGKTVQSIRVNINGEPRDINSAFFLSK